MAGRRARGSGAAPPKARAAGGTDPAGGAERSARIVGAIALALVACAVLYGHALFLRHAGGLWRDEANTVAFAGMRSLADIWSALRHDSVPLASTLLVRGWLGLGLDSDGSLRMLGALVGAAVLAALWLNARWARASLPICSILLFALNVWVIRGGDSIRPLGLGMLFVVLTFTTLGLALERMRPLYVVLAALCATLAVHSVYSNAPLVGGICLAGVAVGIATRSAARIAIGAGVGVAAALSLIPYAGAIRAAEDWSALVHSQADPRQLWGMLQSTAAVDAWGWALLAAIGVVTAVLRARARAGRGARSEDAMRDLYAGVALAAGALAFGAFLVWARLATRPWYYLPLVAMATASLDVLLGPLAKRPAQRVGWAVALMLATTFHLSAAMPFLQLRQTSIDLVAAKLRASAAPGDYVIVCPWFNGITFHRYHSAPVPWSTLPPLEDTRIHRYDLLKQRMQSPGAIDSLLAGATRALQAGGQVWLVGGLPQPVPGEQPALPPPAPSAAMGWSIDAYSTAWGKVVFAFLSEHADQAKEVPVPLPGPVSPYERASLIAVRGWR